MNNVLNQYYDLEVIGIIKVTNKVYRIKTKDNQYYCFKHVDDDNESIFAHISMLSISSFCSPIKNNHGSYITKINNDNFYLIKWYDDDLVLAKEIKLKFFIEELVNLHKLSSYDNKINKGYFEEVLFTLEKMIDDEENDINYYLLKIEKKEYKSPSEWLFLLNNKRFRDAITNAKRHLNKFKENIKNLDVMRVSLNYLNFDFNNILVKEKKILGIEKMKIGPIVYDIKDLFDKSYNLSIDIIMYLKMYFEKVQLLDYEKEWLLTLVSIPFINYETKEEIEEIIDLTKTIYHLTRGYEIEKILDENK